MGLSSRTSRFFGNPSPGKTFGDVARQLNFIIKENTKRTSDVVLAAYSIGCDGAPTVTLLDGSPCEWRVSRCDTSAHHYVSEVV